jgi:hypothetical protein
MTEQRALALCKIRSTLINEKRVLVYAISRLQSLQMIDVDDKL